MAVEMQSRAALHVAVVGQQFNARQVKRGCTMAMLCEGEEEDGCITATQCCRKAQTRPDTDTDTDTDGDTRRGRSARARVASSP